LHISSIVKPSIPPIIGLFQKKLKKIQEFSDILLDILQEISYNNK
jgi:hypothetical protein